MAAALTCACGAVTNSPATHCGKPMASKTAADQSANAVILATGGAKAARTAAKAGRR